MQKKSPYVPLAISIDEQFATGDHLHAFEEYKGKWIKTTREAFGYGVVELAKKLNIAQQSLSELEAREANSVISIKKLEIIAEAMNCRLVYGFIPHEPMSPTAADLYERQEEARRRHRTMPRPA